MASSLSWLHSCNASQLKAIARLTGLASSGTKPLITSRLLQDLPHSFLAGPIAQPSLQTYNQQPTGIISIDMGIRNLAYCRLTLPPVSANASPPLVTDWRRFAITRAQDATEAATEKEKFDPATYSKHAYALIEALLSQETPSHILIERQRFRSMGGSAVLEWTLRVNMFEAMLYAVLATLTARGIWSGSVHAVSPAKVAGFWLEERGEDGPEDNGNGGGKKRKGSVAPAEQDEVETPKIRKKKSAKAGTKTQKIKILSELLNQTPPVVQLQAKSPAADTAKAYLEETLGGGSRKTRKAAAESEEPRTTSGAFIRPLQEKTGKLDDLADCLLQGMAWIQWEKNRARIVERGLSGLEELDGWKGAGALGGRKGR